MSQTACGVPSAPKKWYNSYIFPLVPQLEVREGDDYNTKKFTFRWLFFTFWSLDSFQFEISVVADTHWGLGFVGILPYLRWVVAIPCPVRIGMWVTRNLARKSKKPV